MGLLNGVVQFFQQISPFNNVTPSQRLLARSRKAYLREKKILQQVCKISGCDQDDENLPQLATHPFICVCPGAIYVLDSGGAFSQVWSEIEGWDEFVLEHSFE